MVTNELTRRRLGVDAEPLSSDCVVNKASNPSVLDGSTIDTTDVSAKTAGHPRPATAVSACCCAEGVASTNGERAIGGYNQMLCTGESAPAVCARSRCTHTEESGTHTSGTVTSGLASTDSSADALVACTTTVGQAPSITGCVPIQ